MVEIIPLFSLNATTVLLLITVLSLVLFTIGISIILVFGFWALAFAYFVPAFGYTNMAIVSYEQLNSFPLVAVPLFIAVGSLINSVGMSSQIIGFSRSVGGWLPGSTANTSIYTSGVFAAITGSNTATTASVGEALHDDLVEEGYDPSFSAATIASGGTLGVIIPPSVMFILYGVTFDVSVSALFIAGAIPGIAMMVGLSIVASYISYKRQYGVGDYSFSVWNIVEEFWGARNAFITITLLLGGIYIGLFTPSQSAVVAIAYMLLVGFIGETDWRVIFQSFLQATKLSGMILPVLVVAIMVQQDLSYLGLQEMVGNAVIGLNNPVLIGIAMFVIMLFTGMTLSSVPNMVLTAPLLAPAAFHLGLSPLMWGVVFLINDAIGFITPPYGLNLYVISSITGIDYMRVAKSALPYMLVLYLIWIVFFAFPELNVLAPT